MAYSREYVGGFKSVAVCRRGHVANHHLQEVSDDVPPYCDKCGAEILTECDHCEGRIRGHRYRTSGVFTPPQFCDLCGAPHPWLNRQGRIYLLENRLEAAADVDDATRLKLQEELAALGNADLTDEEEVAHWQRIKQLAPAAWEKTGVQQVATTLITAWGKQQLGLQ